MNLIMIAAVTGFLTGEFVTNFFSENVAHRFEELYANGFYSVPSAPDPSMAYAPLGHEEEYLARLCEMPSEPLVVTVN